MPLGDPETAWLQGLRDGMAGREYSGGDVHRFVRPDYSRGWARGRIRYVRSVATGVPLDSVAA